MEKTQDLIDKAVSLPIEERALLVDTLLRSMNPTDKINDKKWALLAVKRLEELKTGKVKGVPGEDVFHKLWKRFEK